MLLSNRRRAALEGIELKLLPHIKVQLLANEIICFGRHGYELTRQQGYWLPGVADPHQAGHVVRLMTAGSFELKVSAVAAPVYAGSPIFAHGGAFDHDSGVLYSLRLDASNASGDGILIGLAETALENGTAGLCWVALRNSIG
jgi:hypothetical protein